MKFSVFQLSRLGGREKNEDRMGYCYTREAGLFMLADGMGGHPEGEVAAQIALQTLATLFQREANPRLQDVAAFLSNGMLAAHRQIIRHASERGMLDTPRTTIVAALIQDGLVFWAHCGDSRFYLVRAGELLARTRDHSYLEAQSGSGMPVENINRNVLFTCLGSSSRPIIDVAEPISLRDRDKIFLCSDGLWGNVDDHQIAATLSAKTVSHAVPDLIEAALKKGGDRSDNVTGLAVEWDGSAALQGKAASGFTHTEAMSIREFASTVQAAGDLDLVLEDLDETAIERSIAEINEAIQRTATRRR